MKSKLLVKEGKVQKRNILFVCFQGIVNKPQKEKNFAKFDVAKKLEGHTGIEFPDE